MCGIAGVASSWLTQKEFNVFKDMLVCSSLRGLDSTGIFGVAKTTHGKRVTYGTFWKKRAIDATAFLFEQKIQQRLKDTDNKVVVGHARAATQGDITDANAHPFAFPTVVGVHNGTITGKFQNREKYETDSESLYSLIDELGIEEALKLIEQHWGGKAYALVYYNKKEKTLNLIRNKERPLYLAYGSFGHEIFFGSEAWYVQGAMIRNDVKFGTNEHAGHMLEPHTLYTFHVDQTMFTKTVEKRKLEVPPPKTFHQGAHYQGQGAWHFEDYEGGSCDVMPWDRARGGARVPLSQAEGKQKSSGQSADTPPITPPIKGMKWSWDDFLHEWVQKVATPTDAKTPLPKVEEFFPGFQNEFVPRTRMEKILTKGCAYCGKNDLNCEDTIDGKTTFFQRDDFLCEDCSNLPEVSQYLGYTPGVNIH